MTIDSHTIDTVATSLLIELASSEDSATARSIATLAGRLAVNFSEADPRFDHAAFLRNCGVDRFAPEIIDTYTHLCA